MRQQLLVFVFNGATYCTGECSVETAGGLRWLREGKQLKRMGLLVVFISMFLDSMLMSVVVPILPSYLYKIDQAAHNTPGQSANSSVSPSTIYPLSFNASAPLHQRSGLLSDPSTLAHNLSDSNCSHSSAQLGKENVKLGLLLASKATVQLISNIFTGPLTDRVGYHIPLCAGFCITFLSTVLFAFSSSYFLLLLARSVQGVGGSCMTVAGLSMMASVYTDEGERGRAMGIAFSGLAIGLVGGAPIGSVMYQFVGKTPLFLFLASIAVLGGGLHFLIFQPSERPQSQKAKGTPLLTLMKDPYILISAGALCLTTQAIATIEATLPIWMMTTMCVPQWQLGLVFLPDSLCYLVASNIIGRVSHKIRRWLCVFIGMVLMGMSNILFGFSKNIYHLMALNAVVGISVGMVDSTVMPIMADLVDLRYVPMYGNVYAFADVAICIAFAIGPSIGGPIAASIGFPWLMVAIGLANIIFAPLCFFLSNPPQREESVVSDTSDKTPQQNNCGHKEDQPTDNKTSTSEA